MKKTFYCYMCSKDGLTKPVLAGQYLAENQNEAFQRAEKDPAIKRFLKAAQTHQLYLRVTDAQGAVQ